MADRTVLGPQFDDVLAAAQAGAGWAFERLWLSLAPAVAGYLRSQGVRDADDATSEVFIGVFRGIGRFSGSEEQFRSWVFTIAHRRLLDVRRAGSRRPVETGVEEEDLPPVAGPDEDALARLATERVRQVCERLVPDQRDVLLLRLVAGMTVDEVATVTGKSVGAVKQLQRRGLAAVRKIFEQEGVPL